VSRSRPPVVAIVLAVILAGGLVALVVDAGVSAFRTANTVVSVAQQPQAQEQRFPELDDHLMVADRPMPDAECVLPAFARDPAGLRTYYEALTSCLGAAWRPALSAAGVSSRLPSIDITVDPGETGCGVRGEDDVFTAWYCGSDETMYLPLDRMTEWDGGRPHLHLGVVAHEYGHHVQHLSGLLDAADARVGKVGADTPQGKEISRRLELQANCFAGLFLGAIADHGSVTRLDTSTAVDGYRYSGAPSTHGNLAVQTRWVALGYSKGTLSACDTWSAPAKDVAD